MRLGNRTSGLTRAGRVVAIFAVASLTACASNPVVESAVGDTGTMRPYAVHGVWYYPKAQPDYDRQGLASWYGAAEHHHTTADGEVFDMDVASAAHTTLPLPCVVEVTDLDNGRRIRVRVNDRGPFVRGRIIDLSRQAAKDLGFYHRGMARVRVRYIGPAPKGRYADLTTSALSSVALAKVADPTF